MCHAGSVGQLKSGPPQPAGASIAPPPLLRGLVYTKDFLALACAVLLRSTVKELPTVRARTVQYSFTFSAGNNASFFYPPVLAKLYWKVSDFCYPVRKTSTTNLN